ncbi:unnamed protein product, partial [Amoebophrya sp. A25]|eukprot:GSA25T00004779001.1
MQHTSSSGSETEGAASSKFRSKAVLDSARSPSKMQERVGEIVQKCRKVDEEVSRNAQNTSKQLVGVGPHHVSVDLDSIM